MQALFTTYKLFWLFVQFVLRKGFKIVIGYCKSLFAANGGRPVQNFFSQCNIRAPLFWIIYRQWFVNYFLAGSGERYNFFSEIFQTYFVRITNVHRQFVIAQQ